MVTGVSHYLLVSYPSPQLLYRYLKGRSPFIIDSTLSIYCLYWWARYCLRHCGQYKNEGWLMYKNLEGSSIKNISGILSPSISWWVPCPSALAFLPVPIIGFSSLLSVLCVCLALLFPPLGVVSFLPPVFSSLPSPATQPTSLSHSFSCLGNSYLFLKTLFKYHLLVRSFLISSDS